MVLPNKLKFYTLAELADNHMSISKKMFKKEGHVVPFVTGYTIDEKYMIPLVFRNAKERDFILKIIPMFFAIKNINRYTVVHEAWGLEQKGLEGEWQRLKDAGLKISESPLSMKLLVCFACSRKEKLFFTNKISDKGIITELSHKDSVMNIGGQFCDLLPPLGLSDKTLDEIREFLKEAEKKGFTFEQRDL